jgi:hypothetical protein
MVDDNYKTRSTARIMLCAGATGVDEYLHDFAMPFRRARCILERSTRPGGGHLCRMIYDIYIYIYT